MAVMKTCCGCMVTKTGSMTVVVVFLILYIASIVKNCIDLSDPANLGSTYQE